MRTGLNQVSRSSSFQIDDAAKPAFDRVFEARVCKPLADRTPTAIHPNAISLFNHGVMWCAALLAGSSAFLEGIPSLLAIAAAAMGLVASAILDNIDGMHARATGRCSKMGELLDHALDAPNTALNAAAVVLILQLDSWVAFASVVMAPTIYNAQVVLDHHRGKWVAPPTSGPASQIACMVAMIGWGVAFLLVDRQQPTLALLVDIFAWVAVVFQVKLQLFYVIRLGRDALHHLKFVAQSWAVGALYLTGIIDLHAMIVVLACLSYRIIGTYVMRTILVQERYHGIDLATIGWLGAMLGLHFLDPVPVGPVSLQALAPYLCALHLIASNVLDTRRNYDRLVQSGE